MGTREAEGGRQDFGASYTNLEKYIDKLPWEKNPETGIWQSEPNIDELVTYPGKNLRW